MICIDCGSTQCKCQSNNVTIPCAQYEALMAAARALKKNAIAPNLAEPFVLRALAAIRAAGIDPSEDKA